MASWPSSRRFVRRVPSRCRARAWQAALHQAQEWEFGHLSAPPIGTGAGNLTLEDAAEIMVTGLQAHRTNVSGARFPADVSFVVERPEDQQVFEAALQRRGPAA